MSDEVSIVFINTCDDATVKVYWHNEERDQQVLYRELVAGDQYTQHTYKRHKWIITCADDVNNCAQVVADAHRCKCIISTVVIDNVVGVDADRSTSASRVVKLVAMMEELDDLESSSVTTSGTSCNIPPQGYSRMEVAGFIVFYEAGVFDHEPRLREHLTKDLEECRRIIETSATARQLLCHPRVYVNKHLTYNNKPPATPCCCHWSSRWLQQNGNLEEKEGCVEIYDVKQYVDWCKDQPAMLFHELCHSFHWQIRHSSATVEMKSKDAAISEAYEVAKSSGSYESVQYIYGQMVRHYALTNELEYFAECCEAFFSTCRFRNDFFPFIHEELKVFDACGYKMIALVWDVDVLVRERGRVFEVDCPADYDATCRKYLPP